MNALILAALGMGFFGSPHCLGMCGGIVTAFGISMRSVSPAKRRLLIATYHFGRLGSYLLLGLIASLVGQTLIAPLISSTLPRYLLGGALIFTGLMMLGLPILSQLEKVGLHLWNALAPIRSKVLPIDSLPKALAAGLLWGFLPCGMVYGALVVALSLATGGIGMQAVAFMLFFWLGTLPMLLATGGVMTAIGKISTRFGLRKVSGVLMVISGLAVALAMPVMHSLGGHDHSHHGAHHSPDAHSQMADMHDHEHHQEHDADEHSHHTHHHHDMGEMPNQENHDHAHHKHHQE